MRKQIAGAARNWPGGAGGSQPASRIAPARAIVVVIDDFDFGRKRGSVGTASAVFRVVSRSDDRRALCARRLCPDVTVISALWLRIPNPVRAGVNAGASMGSVKTDFNIAPVHGVIVGGVNDGGRFSIPGFAGSDTVYPDGFIGGGQTGYNWQFSPIWVVGLEADFQGAVEKDSATLTNSFTVPIGFPVLALIAPAPTVSATGVINYATKIEWFGTALACWLCVGEWERI